MATYLENLTTSRDKAAEALAGAMTAAATGDGSAAGGAPNSPSGIDHDGFCQRLRATIAELNDLIGKAGGDAGPPPYESITEVVT